jgi:hypoxanthine phosphoribosyltransferase
MQDDNKLTSIVNNLLSNYEGGEIYFDNLDKEIKDKENLDLVETVISRKSHDKIIVIGTGGFGLHAFEHFAQTHDIVVVNGNLRKQDEINIVESNIDWSKLINQNVLFVDDSYYSGGTEEKVSKFLLEHFNAKIISSSVVYDGSIKKRNHVKSLFRYYNKTC